MGGGDGFASVGPCCRHPPRPGLSRAGSPTGSEPGRSQEGVRGPQPSPATRTQPHEAGTGPTTGDFCAPEGKASENPGGSAVHQRWGVDHRLARAEVSYVAWGVWSKSQSHRLSDRPPLQQVPQQVTVSPERIRLSPASRVPVPYQVTSCSVLGLNCPCLPCEVCFGHFQTRCRDSSRVKPSAACGPSDTRAWRVTPTQLFPGTKHPDTGVFPDPKVLGPHGSEGSVLGMDM